MKFPDFRLLHTMGAVAVFLVFCVCQQGVGAREQEMIKLSLNLDPVLALPGLWELSPEGLEEKCRADGFDKNPFFNWAKEEQSGKRFAFFSEKPFSNVEVDAALFGGRVKVRQMVLEFTNGRVSEVLVVTQTPPRGEGLLGADATQGIRTACLAGLEGLVKGKGKEERRFFGSKAARSLETLTLSGEGGTACLDASVAESLVRFTLAPKGVPVADLLAKPVVELDLRATEFFCDLDALLKLPGLWELTPDQLDNLFGFDSSGESPCYQWLDAARTSVRFSRQPYSNITVDLMVFQRRARVDEVVIDFEQGKAARANVSLYNRGDSGPISREEFDTRFKIAGQALVSQLGVRPVERRPTAQTAVKTSGWLWSTPHTLALLEHNVEALTKKGTAEFLRLRLTPVAGKERLLNIAAIGQRTTTLGRSDLPRHVRREPDGDVYVGDVPMVDQGAKGYCVVASCQRLFGYLNIPCDQHELALIAGSDASLGTSGASFVESLNKIDNRFKVRFKPLLEKHPLKPSVDRAARPDRFAKMVQEYVDRGIPLLWALELGVFPEEPNIVLQAGGGHMRLLIGYNSGREEILFSDSWGAGHELKRMKLEHALAATAGLYAVEPKER